MKIIVRNSDNTVVAFGENIELTNQCIQGNGWINIFYTLENSSLIDNVTLPNNFFPNIFYYSGGIFTVINQNKLDELIEKITPIPASVTPRQMEEALLEMELLDTVLAIVDQSPRTVQIKWNRSVSFERANPIWDQMCILIKKTPKDIDNLFRLAANK